MSFDFINETIKKIHFIGIGGVSMSGLAEIMLKNGYKVSGSDMNQSPITKKLKKDGATIFIGHEKANVKDIDLVVYTAAVSKDNPELVAASELNIPLMDRAEFLGKVMKNHKFNIAVSGTHGKTTTTSMLSHILLEAKTDPTILVGGQLDVIDGNVRTGESEYFLTEACEYKASFLKFYPYVGVILNIDADHLDYYRDIEHIKDTFKIFAGLIPNDGFLVCNADDPKVMEIIKDLKCNIITFGMNNGDLRATDIRYDDRGCVIFNLEYNGKQQGEIHLNVHGEHNIYNALAAIGSAISLNLDMTSTTRGIESFGGTHRRFEIKGTYNDVTVIDDYAHHPTEIKVTLNAAQNYKHQRIVCIFQPHTYTRTLSLLNEFSSSFNGVDEVILTDIYAAREKDPGTISSEMLEAKIKENGVKCRTIHDFHSIVEYLDSILKPGDILLTVGAGDVFKIGDLFLNR